jgi:hypothetical protein
MTKKTDQMREEIARTKADLTNKLGQLEGQVRDEVSGVKEGVEEAIDSVKSTARMFSLTYQIQQRPLLMAGGSMLTGLVLTRWLVGPGHRRAPMAEESYRAAPAQSIVGAVVQRYPDEARVIKTMAFSFLINLVAQKAKAGWPHLVDTIGAIERRLKDQLSTKK